MIDNTLGPHQREIRVCEIEDIKGFGFAAVLVVNVDPIAKWLPDLFERIPLRWCDARDELPGSDVRRVVS